MEMKCFHFDEKFRNPQCLERMSLYDDTVFRNVLNCTSKFSLESVSKISEVYALIQYGGFREINGYVYIYRDS